MRLLLATLALATLVVPAAADIRDRECDRTGDSKVTAVDALAALEMAVESCKRTLECDSDGDDDSTAADALALLRYAVGMPQELACTCLHIDECFEDEDCVGYGYPEGSFCAGYLCAECEFDRECPAGMACDRCSLTCIDAPAE